MRVTRAYVDAPLTVGATLTLPEGAAVHMLRVLRLGVGDGCVLFNGDGRDFAATIVSADKRGAAVKVIAAANVHTESPLRIVLLQGIARGDKMDWILQKATELGVTAFVPVHSDRSEVKLDAARAGKRHTHWVSVATAACEQCGRARVPGVGAPVALAVALAALGPGGLRLTLDPLAAASAATIDPVPCEDVIVAIGPEGGWSNRDRAALESSGFAGMRLGPRILRTETAGIAAISVLQALYGDLAAVGSADTSPAGDRSMG